MWGFQICFQSIDGNFHKHNVPYSKDFVHAQPRYNPVNILCFKKELRHWMNGVLITSVSLKGSRNQALKEDCLQRKKEREEEIVKVHSIPRLTSLTRWTAVPWRTNACASPWMADAPVLTVGTPWFAVPSISISLTVCKQISLSFYFYFFLEEGEFSYQYIYMVVVFTQIKLNLLLLTSKDG